MWKWPPRLKGRELAVPVTIAVLLAVLYGPVLVYLVRVWLESPYYSHGFLVLIVSAVIAWLRRKELLKGRPAAAGAAVLALGLAVYVAGFVYRIQWLWASSVVPVLAGLLLQFRGVGATRAMLFPLLFLFLMIPLPLGDLAAVPLQSVSAGWSAWLLQTLGVPVVRTGCEIQLAGTVFLVGAPCSGMQTLVSLLAFAVLFAYLLKGPYLRRTFLVLLALPAALVANVVRITFLVYAARTWGEETTLGVLHGASSVAVFLLVVMLLFLVARVLRCRLTQAESG